MMSDVLLAAGSSFGPSVALKSTLLVVLGLTVSGLLGRRACSSSRHLVLVVTFGALLALPAVAAMSPAVRVPLNASASAAPERNAAGGSNAQRGDPLRRVPIADGLAQDWSMPRVVHAAQNWSAIDWSVGAAWMMWTAYGTGVLLSLLSLAGVQLLVSSGADVNARVWADSAMERGGEWRRPVSMARKGGHTAVVSFLLNAGAR